MVFDDTGRTQDYICDTQKEIEQFIDDGCNIEYLLKIGIIKNE